MPKCPECGKEISELHYELIDGGRVFIDEDGDVEYELASDIYGDDVVGVRFKCPECGAELFDDRDDAEDFLKGDRQPYS